MRTPGNLTTLGLNLLTSDQRGLTELIGNYHKRLLIAAENVKHAAACWNAIESIGGAPAMVGRMVDEIKQTCVSLSLRYAYDGDTISGAEGVEKRFGPAIADSYVKLRAILAQLPKENAK